MITDNLLENCNSCYPFQLSELLSSITIKGGLTNGENYIVKATDKFGNSFSTGPVTAGVDGSLLINIPQSFPQQWLNRNAGSFFVQVSKTARPWLAETLTLGGKPYTCMVIDFVADDTGINVIA